MNRHHDVLIHRHEGNPILTAADWPYAVNTVFNAGAASLPDGSTLLLCRVEDRSGISHLCAARSRDGISNWQIDAQPTLSPDPLQHPEELWGIEDPRVTWVPELNKYVITYTSYSHGGPGVSLATTEDFRTFERYGVVMPPEDKDAALLPRRIGGSWALIHRPVTTWRGAHMWISYSPDLRHWGSHRLILAAREGAWWDANKIGLSPPPIETSEGWLVIYHGVRQTAGGCLYRLGLALFDLATPERCVLQFNRKDSTMETSELRSAQKTLIARLKNSQSDKTLSDSIRIDQVSDPLDMTQQAVERELAMQILDHESSLVRRIRAALDRIDDGSYGLCSECEEEIAPKRLKAIPWAERCIRCQQNADGIGGQGEGRFDFEEHAKAA